MKKILLAALIAYCTGASATVLSFDDIPGGLTSIPDGYGGFNWNNYAGIGVFSTADIANGSVDRSYANGIYSGQQAGFNFGGESPGIITMSMGGATFDFNGAYFTSTDSSPTDDTPSITSQTLVFVGYVNNVEMGRTTRVITDVHSPLAFQNVGFTQIDTLQIFSLELDGSNPPPWVMDDFTFNATNQGGDSGGGGDTAPVPEPLSLSLMGLGLAALGVARRKKI